MGFLSTIDVFRVFHPAPSGVHIERCLSFVLSLRAITADALADAPRAFVVVVVVITHTGLDSICVMHRWRYL